MMTAPRSNTAGRRIKACGCVMAVLLGIAGLCDPTLATAAEVNRGPVGPILMHRPGPTASPAVRLPAARRVIVERRETRQVAQNGPVVLRGSRSPRGPAEGAPVIPGTGGEGYGSSAAPPATALPNDGGFDTSLDRSGLSPPGGVLRLGQ